MNNFTVDYGKYLSLSYKILEEVKNSGRKYDAILCPLRGGFFLSYFMGKHLNIPIRYMEISSYKDKVQSEFHIGIIPELPDGKFLLCDDIYDSGKTINKILEIYHEISMDIACLISKKKHDNYFIGEYVESDRWVDFFWEIM